MSQAAESSEKQANYKVLALKYRPQVFADVVGQRAVVRQLQGEIVDGRVGHAYLFTGPRGVGKTSMARIFAKALNCVEGPTPSPCGKCVHCLGIANDSDLDVVEVDAATYTKKEETVELLEGIDRVAFNARYKVYIIDEVHMFSTASFNVLLKRLEEPPPGVVFILATTNPEKIPETVISRCRRLEFERIDTSDIVGRLKEIAGKEHVSLKKEDHDAVLEAIALASEGGMRDAQVAFDQLISLSEGEITMEAAKQLLGIVEGDLLHDLLDAVAKRDTVRCLMIVHDLVEKGRDLQRFIKTFTQFLRDAMLVKANAPDELLRVSRSHSTRLRALVSQLSMPYLLNLGQQFLDLEERMKGGSPARFLLEFALMKVTAIHPHFVLDSIDAGNARPAGAGNSGGEGASGASAGAPRSARVEEVVPRDANAGGGASFTSMPRAMVMREAALAEEEVADVELGDTPPEASTTWPPSEEQISDFKSRVKSGARTVETLISAGKLTFGVTPGNVEIELAPHDGMMKATVEKQENMVLIREAGEAAFGLPLRIVRVVLSREAPQRREAAAPPPMRQEARVVDVVREDEVKTAPNQPVSDLTLTKALEEYPDFREALAVIRDLCGAEPAFFNGVRITNQG